MARKIVNIEFPLGGISRQFAFQRQQPYTTPDALNVLARGAQTGRARGGSRPGLSNEYSNGVSSPYGFCMAKTVHPVAGTLGRVWLDDFEGVANNRPISDNPWWKGTIPGLISAGISGVRINNNTYAAALGPGDVSNVAEPVPIDSSQAYSISFVWGIKTHAEPAQLGYAKMTLYMAMDDASPNVSDCIEVQVWGRKEPVAGLTEELKISFNKIVGGATVDGATTGYVTMASYQGHYITITNNAGTIQASLDGSVVLTDTYTDLAGTRFGMWHRVERPYGYVPDVWPDARIIIDNFQVAYQVNGAVTNLNTSRPLLVIGETQYGGLMRESLTSASTALAAVSTTGQNKINLSTASRIMAAEYGGKLYIADYATSAIKSGISATLGNANVPSDAEGFILQDDGFNFSTLAGRDKLNQLCVVESSSLLGAKPAVPGAYPITTFASSSLVLDCPSAFDSGVHYRVARAPKVYNPATDTLSLWTQKRTAAGKPYGVMPVGCPIIAVYQSRLVLAGYPAHVWYMSRQGDPEDWQTGADPNDVGRAVGGTLYVQGQIPRKITAVAPFRDDMCIFGCDSELWVMHGSPTTGGGMMAISRSVGICDRFGWCYTDHGSLIFLDAVSGLYELSPGGGSYPAALSRDVLPAELRRINTEITRVSVGWDADRVGVHIYLSKTYGDYPATHWFYDYRNKSFWPWEMDADLEPSFVLTHQPPGRTSRRMLLASRDGRLRYYDETTGADRDINSALVAFDSGALLGPFRMNNSGYDTFFAQLHGILSENSGATKWAVYSGESPEQAYAAYEANSPSASGTWAAGRNNVVYPRRHANCHYVWVGSDTGAVTSWETEELLAAFERAGTHRPL